jgi:type IV pilus assembly protein PilV
MPQLNSKRRLARRPTGRMSGFTLLEVLVAIVILAIGLLGVAGLQATSIRNNQSAYLRSQATLLAYDVIDRMRANTTLARAGSYSVAFGSSGSGSGMAGIDITEWKTTLAQLLPSGDGSVTVDLAGNASIVVRWVDDRNGNTLSFTTQTKL